MSRSIILLLTFRELPKNYNYICLHDTDQMINKFSKLRNLNLRITSSKHVPMKVEFVFVEHVPFSKETNLPLSLKQANKKELTFSAFHAPSTLRQNQIFFIHQIYLTCHCRTK